MTTEVTEAQTLEWQYFQWLYSMIGAVTDRNPGHSHFMLIEQLHKKTFIWHVPNDDNRGRDGLALRDEFVDQINSWSDCQRPYEPCSMLEMLIGLAKLATFDGDGVGMANTLGDWFWRMLENCGLKQYNDSRYFEDDGRAIEAVDEIIDDIVTRRYHASGFGGLFPLEHPTTDQRKTELWYQLSAYLLENSEVAH